MATENPSSSPEMGAGPGSADPFSHGAIGNYKGVMLCNRPNEPGEPMYKER